MQWLLGCVFAGLAGVAGAEAPLHLGAVTCGNSTCHDAPAPSSGSNITQREFAIWRDHDKHSKAYAALLTPRAKTIAANAGIDAPEKSSACLSCHSDNVPVAQRGKRFKIEDGIACEACHGGGEKWLGTHAFGSGGHAANIAAGMYPTDDPTARAKLCLGCHMFKDGDDNQHRYYAAGHPRLKFELDTYTEERPAHHQIDADYRRRKPGSYGARAWLLGEAAASRKLVDRLSETAGKGPWPDLSTFACYGCHRKPGAGQAGGSGYPLFQDAPVQMLIVALDALGIDSAAAVRDGIKHLNSAVGSGSTAQWKASAEQLSGVLVKAEGTLRARPEKADDAQTLMLALMAHAKAGEFTRQHLAEQATYAMATLRLASAQLAKVNEAGANQALDHLFDAAGQTSTFDAGIWNAAAVELAAAIHVSTE
jgi:hypothetical protein